MGEELSGVGIGLLHGFFGVGILQERFGGEQVKGDRER